MTTPAIEVTDGATEVFVNPTTPGAVTGPVGAVVKYAGARYIRMSSGVWVNVTTFFIPSGGGGQVSDMEIPVGGEDIIVASDPAVRPVAWRMVDFSLYAGASIGFEVKGMYKHDTTAANATFGIFTTVVGAGSIDPRLLDGSAVLRDSFGLAAGTNIWLPFGRSAGAAPFVAPGAALLVQITLSQGGLAPRFTEVGAVCVRIKKPPVP